MELHSGVDYRINKFSPGHFWKDSHDFIAINGQKLQESQLEVSKWESVYNPITIIVNTRSAALHMSTFVYPDCINEFKTNRSTYPEKMELDINQDRFFILLVHILYRIIYTV